MVFILIFGTSKFITLKNNRQENKLKYGLQLPGFYAQRTSFKKVKASTINVKLSRNHFEQKCEPTYPPRSFGMVMKLRTRVLLVRDRSTINKRICTGAMLLAAPA